MPSAPRLECLLHPSINDVDGKRENDRGVLLRSDFGQRLKVTELDSSGLSFQNTCSFGEFRRCLRFAIGMNDLSAPLAFGFGLASNGPLHLLRNINLLHFHLGNLNTPRLGV